MRTQREKEFLQYQREFLLPNNFYHHLGVCFQDEWAERTFLLDFHRARDAPPFGRLESARAKIVAMLLHAKAAQFDPADNLDEDECGPTTADARTEFKTHRCRGVSRGFNTERANRRLTARELEVAESVARGLSNKEIGRALNISVRTVENHMRSIFEKLEIKTRTRLAAKLHEVKSNRSVRRGTNS